MHMNKQYLMRSIERLLLISEKLKQLLKLKVITYL